MADSIFSKYRINDKKLEVKDEVVAVPNIITRYMEKTSEIPIVEEARGKIIEKERKEENIEIREKVQEMLNKQANVFDRLKKTSGAPKDVSGLKNVEYEDHNPRFMKQFPRHELRHKDHSGIIIAKQCLRKYFYREILNLITNEHNVIFLPWATAYWHKHGEDQKVGTKYDWYTTERFYSSLVKAFEHWVSERKLGRVKVITIEQYFNVQIKDGRYVQGRTDEVVEIKDELWGRDFKTTGKPQEWFKNQLNPNNQVRTYTFGTSRLSNRNVRGILIQALFNGKSTKQGPKGPDIYEEIIEVTDYELEQWEEEQVQWNNILELCREKDVWPQTETQCAWCEYNIVCRKGSEASMVYTLENKFQKKLRDPSRMDDE